MTYEYLRWICCGLIGFAAGMAVAAYYFGREV